MPQTYYLFERTKFKIYSKWVYFILKWKKWKSKLKSFIKLITTQSGGQIHSN